MIAFFYIIGVSSCIYIWCAREIMKSITKLTNLINSNKYNTKLVKIDF